MLFLWAQNRAEVRFGDVIGPLLLVLGTTSVCFAVASLLLRDHRRGAVAASGLAFLALSYGHVRAVLPPAVAAPEVLLTAWALLGVFVIAAAIRVRAASGDITRALNLVASVLVVTAVVPLAPRLLSPGAPGVPASPSADDGTHRTTPGGRDIFYIVPDRYPSERNLRELFDHDNSAFTTYLEEQGFQVADDSLSNYNKTAHSLAAALNLDYIDDLAEEMRTSGADQSDWTPLYDRLHDHEVGRFLTGNGYLHIQLGMWWEPTATAATADVTYRYDEATEFGRVFEGTTVIRTVRSLVRGEPEERGDRWRHREGLLFQLRKLDEVAARRPARPLFVFAHLGLPHEPYVFDADGGWVSEQQQADRTYEENFLGHIEYTNRRLRGVIDELLSGPEDEHPIIIIQADEALHPERYRRDEPPFVWPEATDAELLQKFRILSAFYLPGVDTEVPDDITPVNTFRLVFDAYFGADHGPLPDRSYVMYNHHRLYELTDVTERLRTADPIPEGFEP